MFELKAGDGTEVDPTVENYQSAPGGEATRIPFGTFGTVGCGYELCSDAWPAARHVFSVNDWKGTSSENLLPGHRMPKGTLNRYPMEALVVDQGHRVRAPAPTNLVTKEWEEEVARAHCPPKLVIESWLSDATVWPHGPLSKGTSSRWAKLGYTTRGLVVQSTRVGGAITQARLLVVGHLDSIPSFQWPVQDDPSVTPRAMSNLLTPPGLVPRDSWRRRLPKYAKRYWVPHQDPMPWEDGLTGTHWIHLDKGYRPITGAEMLQGLGRKASNDPKTSLLRRTSSVFLWEYLGRALAGQDPPV